MSDVAAGGFTVFPKLGLFFEPRAGDLLFWNLQRTDGSIDEREKLYIETDSSVRPDTNQLQYSLETLLAFVQNPTAPPSLPGVVVSVFALHSIDCLFCITHKVLSGSI